MSFNLNGKGNSFLLRSQGSREEKKSSNPYSTPMGVGPSQAEERGRRYKGERPSLNQIGRGKQTSLISCAEGKGNQLGGGKRNDHYLTLKKKEEVRKSFCHRGSHSKVPFVKRKEIVRPGRRTEGRSPSSKGKGERV